MCSQTTSREFKFHWLNEQGQPTSVFKKKGQIDSETITLEETDVPIAAILAVDVRDQVMAFSVATGNENNPVVTLVVQFASAKDAQAIKKELDITRSAVWAVNHREELEKKGEAGRFRSEVCPRCDATLILTDMNQTPQLYCHFCDSLSTTSASADPVHEEKDLRICEECGMYTSPRKFTIFYFYFLLVVYGWWSKPTWRCPPCMRGEAWKMFFGNLLFLIGLPTAIIQLCRSYGGSSVGGKYKGLDTGNIKARKGDLAGAVQSYRAILERIPVSAGVKYNLGIALLAQGDEAKAASAFEVALADCANYVPAYQQLRFLYEKGGETEKLKELERVWSDGQQEGEDDIPEPEPLTDAREDSSN